MIINNKRYYIHMKHAEILRESLNVGSPVSFFIKNSDNGEYEVFSGNITEKYEYIFLLDSHNRSFTWKDLLIGSTKARDLALAFPV